jgi:hypothetical protein
MDDKEDQFEKTKATASKLGKVLNNEEFGIVIHALCMLLGQAGAQADMLSKRQFVANVVEELSMWYEFFEEESGNDTLH